jgi:hypothetical protein
LLAITVGKARTAYLLQRVPADFGAAFALTKLALVEVEPGVHRQQPECVHHVHFDRTLGDSCRRRDGGQRRMQNLLFGAWRVRGAPREIHRRYRRRFGIEASYAGALTLAAAAGLGRAGCGSANA